MSALDDTIRNLKSLNNLPKYTLRKVKEYCPVDNNVNVPPEKRLRRSFKVRQIGESSWEVYSDCEYLPYVVHGRGEVRPKNAKHLRWNAFGHGNGAFYPSHGGTGYFFSGHAKASTANPFIDRAYWDVMDHISRMSLSALAHELEVGASDEGITIDNM